MRASNRIRLALPLLGAALLAAIPACTDGGSGGGAGSTAASATGTGGTTPPPQLLAGAAAVDVTPPPGAPLAGFGATPRRVINAITIPLQLIAATGNCFDPNPNDAVTFFEGAKGTLDPIMAKALVLSNGTTKVAIVKVDAIGPTRRLFDDIRAVAVSLGIPDQNVVLSATHTHSGPGAMSDQKLWQLLAADCYNDGVYQRMRMGCEQALRTADAGLRPAALGIGTGVEANASNNRRQRPTIKDDELGLVKIVDAQSGAAIAAMLNFAVHGTALGISNLFYSADLMGACEREIEAQLGGVAIFTNGAEGDVAPAGGLGAGSLLAQDCLALWPGIQTKSWVELGGAFEDLPLPRPTFNTGCFPIPGGSKTVCDFLPGFSLQIPLDASWLSRSAPMTAIRIDRTVFATMPGEPITEVGWSIKSRALAKGFDRGFVIGLGNDYLGYIATQSEYFRGAYEGSSTLFGSDMAATLEQAVDRCMDRVKP